MTTPELPRRTAGAAALDDPRDSPAAVAADVPLQVREQGELIATIPTLIGFHPHNSLVLLSTGGESGRRIGLTLRIDLPPPEHTAAAAVAAVSGLLRDGPVGAVIVVVGAAEPGGDPPHRPLVTLVEAELGRHGVEVLTVLWTPATTAGVHWRCYDPCECSGELPDPAASPVLAAAVADGQVVHADRTVLEQLVAPAADGRIRRREKLLTQADDCEPEKCFPEPDVGPVDAALADAEAGRLVLDDERVVALAIALTAPAVRDAALLRCVGPRGEAAEHLWAALTRETPDPEAAEPASLLAVSALLRGDGALANVALDRAEQAWPGHRLTSLLRMAAGAGFRPEEVRQWLLGFEEPAPSTGCGGHA